MKELQQQQTILKKQIENIVFDLDKLENKIPLPDKRQILNIAKHLWIAVQLLKRQELIENQKKAGD